MAEKGSSSAGAAVGGGGVGRGSQSGASKADVGSKGGKNSGGIGSGAGAGRAGDLRLKKPKATPAAPLIPMDPIVDAPSMTIDPVGNTLAQPTPYRRKKNAPVDLTLTGITGPSGIFIP